jgi:Flp pilus assembly protein TadG
MKRRSKNQERRGVAVVEVAFILPILLIFLVGMWDLGQLVRGLQIVSMATRDAGRQAASGTKNSTQIGNAVKLMMTQNGIAEPDITFTYENQTQPGVEPNAATQGDKLNITISIPFSTLRLATGTLAPYRLALTNASFKSQWVSMRDLPVNIDTTIPKE